MDLWLDGPNWNLMEIFNFLWLIWDYRDRSMWGAKDKYVVVLVPIWSIEPKILCLVIALKLTDNRLWVVEFESIRLYLPNHAMYHLMMGCVPDAEGGHQIFCGSRIKKGVSSAIPE